jgi:hypothetical protein
MLVSDWVALCSVRDEEANKRTDPNSAHFSLSSELDEELIQKFKAEDIDTGSLLSFADEEFKDLGELGITLGKRKKIKTSASCDSATCKRSRPSL